MGDILNMLASLETALIRLGFIATVVAAIVVGILMFYEIAKSKSTVRWDRYAYMIVAVVFLQLYLRFVPAMTTRSMVIGLENTRQEFPAFEGEMDHWRLSTGIDYMAPTSTPEPAYVPAAPVVPPPTPWPTAQPTWAPPPTSPVMVPPPTSVVTQPAGNPTPSDITRTP